METQGNLAEIVLGEQLFTRGEDFVRETRVVSNGYPIKHLPFLGIVKISVPKEKESIYDDANTRILVFYRENTIEIFNKKCGEIADKLSRAYESRFHETFRVEHHY